MLMLPRLRPARLWVVFKGVRGLRVWCHKIYLNGFLNISLKHNASCWRYPSISSLSFKFVICLSIQRRPKQSWWMTSVRKLASQRKIKLKVLERRARRFVVLFLYNSSSNVSSLKTSCPTPVLHWPLSSWIFCDLEVPSSSNVSPAPITDSRAQPYQLLFLLGEPVQLSYQSINGPIVS